MKKLLLLVPLLLSACDAADSNIKCGGYTLGDQDEFRAIVITPEDRYLILNRTESECGYRYELTELDTKIALWDNCVGDWKLYIENDIQISCK